MVLRTEVLRTGLGEPALAACGAPEVVGEGAGGLAQLAALPQLQDQLGVLADLALRLEGVVPLPLLPQAATQNRLAW